MEEFDVDEREVERQFREEFGDDVDSVSRSGLDVVLLKRAVLNEKGSPCLLHFEEELVKRVQTALRSQEVRFDRLAKNMGNALRATVIQMEMDRVRYILAEYLRTRLAKIQKYALHTLADPETQSKLSEKELTFATKFLDLEAEHLQKVVLRKIPRAFRDLTEKNEDVNMIPEPDMDSYVFCRVDRDIGEIQIEDEAGTTSSRFFKNELIAIRFAAVEQLVANGDVHLV